MTAPAADPNGRMRIVAARELAPGLPAELEALLVTERSPEGASRRLCVAGDVGLSGKVPSRPGQDPFAEIAPVLQQADQSFANLETPLLDRVEAGALFAAPASAAPLLAAAGFDLLNLANNHVLDHGPGGLVTTREALAVAGVETLGAGPDPAAARRLAVRDLGGLRLGWLGCARTLQPQEPPGEGFWEYAPDELETAIRQARGRVDVLAVSIHMGYMYVDYPHPGQRLEVLRFLDAGADLVVLHHAHVLQGIEQTAGGLACYNLGNLLFDWTEGAITYDREVEGQRSGAVFVFDLDRRGICRAGLLPVRVDDRWHLRWASGNRGRAILERVMAVSGDWQAGAAHAFHRQLADRATGLAAKEAIGRLRRGGLRAALELARRARPHHLRMVAGWPLQKLRRWWRR